MKNGRVVMLFEAEVMILVQVLLKVAVDTWSVTV